MATTVGAGDDTTPGRTNQRSRILDAALELMSEHGAGATSMRQLAKACGVNVAALYHYFPSKADLLRSLIEERQYGLQLQELPVVPGDQPPRDIVAGLIETIWLGVVDEERIWRLLLGEALRGDDTALAVGSELLETIEHAVDAWFRAQFPGRQDRAELAVDLITSSLSTTFVERVFLPDRDLPAVRARAQRLAAAIFPG